MFLLICVAIMVFGVAYSLSSSGDKTDKTASEVSDVDQNHVEDAEIEDAPGVFCNNSSNPSSSFLYGIGTSFHNED